MRGEPPAGLSSPDDELVLLLRRAGCDAGLCAVKPSGECAYRCDCSVYGGP